MKTYEIKMNRSRWMSLLIAILCIAIIVTLCSPYFTYGKATSTYVPDMGDEAMLYGKTWVLSGSEEGVDGYQRIEISKDGKNSTVYTTNILRVNQIAAQKAYDAALANYNTLAETEEATEVALLECKDAYAALEAIKAGTEDYTKSLDTAAKKLAEAEKVYGIATASRVAAKEALDKAYEAVKKAFSVESEFAWISVDQTAEYKALCEAYPDEADLAAATTVRVDAFTAYVCEKYAAELKTYHETNKTAMDDAKKVAKAESKFYSQKLSALSTKEAAALAKEFMAAQAEITDDEIATVGPEIINVLTTEMSAAQYDEKIAGELKAKKAVSAEAAALAAEAQKATDAAAKDGAAKNTVDKAKKDIDAVNKEIAKYTEAAAEAKTYTATAIERAVKAADIDTMEAAEKGQDTLMKTTATVKYNKGKVTFTFANGDKKETTFATSVAYDKETSLSILGYVGFPYNHEDFTNEMAYEIKDYYINDVVILPIAILVLSIIGIVICFVKKDSFATGICPAVAAIVGLIGYATSDFMKLGDKFSTHMIVYAVVLVIAALQIALGLKEKKAK